jgi:phosphate transport system permease protein
VELLAAVPSVVYGLWGLFVLAPVMRTVVQPALGKWLGFLPLFQGPPLGIGMLTGGVLLSIMILPTVAAIARDVFAAVPIEQREGMLALGSTRWEMLTKAVLPYARQGVIGALVLALGRAMGEAMAVVMVIGNTPAVSASLFRPAYTMASVLANEFTEATGQTYVAMLIEIGLLLFGMSIVVNVIARALVWSVSPKGTRAV